MIDKSITTKMRGISTSVPAISSTADCAEFFRLNLLLARAVVPQGVTI